MPWPKRANIDALQLKRENDGLRTTILCLKRELENKQGHVQRLEALLCSRLQTIDELHAKLDSLREQIKRLTAERAQAQSQA
jgi:septal ring factor EnvC (AmiA/AmiB activator)